jgi:Ca2+-binding RTX toxin-like protein
VTNGTGNTLNNVFTGNTANNTFTGNEGNDTYNFQNPGDFANETSATGGIDLVNFTGTADGQLYTLAAGWVENLTLLGAFATNGTGNARNNAILGNAFANTLNGGIGIDTLNGGLGNDTLTGGTDNDIFVFNTTPNMATNRDRITDLNLSGNDIIHLENAIFAGLGAANNRALTALEFNTNNANGVALRTTDRVILDQDSGQLWYDSNGSALGGVIVNFATVNLNQAVTLADFLVI